MRFVNAAGQIRVGEPVGVAGEYRSARLLDGGGDVYRSDARITDTIEPITKVPSARLRIDVDDLREGWPRRVDPERANGIGPKGTQFYATEVLHATGALFYGTFYAAGARWAEDGDPLHRARLHLGPR